MWQDHRRIAMPSKLDLLQGTLDLMVLQTLAAMGALHGYGIARRIEQISGDEVLFNQGTIYASLVRLQQRKWISAKWGTSENNRKAKFYSITKAGRKQLTEDAAYWSRLSGVMGRVLAMSDRRRKIMGALHQAIGRVRAFFSKQRTIRSSNPRWRLISIWPSRRTFVAACLRRRRGVRRCFALAECSRRAKSIARRAGCRGSMCWDRTCDLRFARLGAIGLSRLLRC
jgi:PadR family transcriptional regulator PadR